MENNFDIVSRCCLSLENVNAGRILIKKNTLVTCNSTAFRILNCKSSKDDIKILENSLSGVYNTALHVDSSVVYIKDNTFISSTCAVYVYLIASNPQNWDDIMQDSHKDIILRDSNKDSFLGASNYTHGALNNISLMAGFENVPVI